MKRENIRWGLWMPLVIVGATVLAYVNAFAVPFIFDDELIIVNNPALRHLWPIRLAARWFVDLTFKVNYATGQLRVADYHATNLLIHVLAALALYGVVRRTLLMPRVGDLWRRHSTILAGVIAALWAVHPIQTQSVTYICQRYESMMGLCYLVTLYAFIRAVQAAVPWRRVWYGVSVGMCLLGMGTKEVMVTAPLVILLYDMVVVASSLRELVRRRLAVHIGLWLTVAVFVLMEMQMFRIVAAKGQGVTLSLSPITYLLTQMQVIPHYLRLSIFPHPLCFDYAWPFVRHWSEAVLPGIILVGIGLMTLWPLIHRRPSAFPGVWFFCVLAPTSSLIPVPDAAYEYRMYLPLAAVLACVVLGGYAVWFRRAGENRRHAIIGGGMCVVLLAMAITMTVQRNNVYRSGLTVWADVVNVRPGNVRARLNFAAALLAADRDVEAEGQARFVINQLAYCKALKVDAVPGWGQTAEEVVLYRDVRHYAIAHNYMGIAAIKRRDAAEAEAHFAEAVRLLPQFADAARNLRQVRLSVKKKSPAEAGLFHQIDSRESIN